MAEVGLAGARRVSRVGALGVVLAAVWSVGCSGGASGPGSSTAPTVTTTPASGAGTTTTGAAEPPDASDGPVDPADLYDPTPTVYCGTVPARDAPLTEPEPTEADLPAIDCLLRGFADGTRSTLSYRTGGSPVPVFLEVVEAGVVEVGKWSFASSGQSCASLELIGTELVWDDCVAIDGRTGRYPELAESYEVRTLDDLRGVVEAVGVDCPVVAAGEDDELVRDLFGAVEITRCAPGGDVPLLVLLEEGDAVESAIDQSLGMLCSDGREATASIAAGRNWIIVGEPDGGLAVDLAVAYGSHVEAAVCPAGATAPAG